MAVKLAIVMRGDDSGWRRKSALLRTTLDVSVAAAVERAADILVEAVKANLSGPAGVKGLPVGIDSGHLIGSIEKVPLTPTSVLVRQNRRQAFYGPLIERGTHSKDGSWHVRPQPFFGNAVRDTARPIQQELDRTVRIPIRLVGRAT